MKFALIWTWFKGIAYLKKICLIIYFRKKLLNKNV